jgi:2-C-methyl-D-erythritol 4-phosphate cytidylyltransferase
MHLLIPAAGMGKRMESEFATRGLRQRNKLLMTLRGKPLLAWTLIAAEKAASISWIGIIGQAEDRADIESILGNISLSKPVQFIQGGATRQASVYNEY